MTRESSFHPRYSEADARVAAAPLVVPEISRKVRSGGANENGSKQHQ